MKKENSEETTTEKKADEKQKNGETYYLKIVADGPYLVYGNPPIQQQIILPDESGASWVYREGYSYTPQGDHCALCRCGESEHKPFCDGSHKKAEWDPTETNDRIPFADGVERYEGETLILDDNEEYCAFARFCDAKGRIWNIVERARSEEEKNLAVHEAVRCPGGRLVLYDKATGKVFEPPFAPSIGIIEDPGIKVSGPIWLKGGIRVESSDGSSYEIRNRVTLCRCGQSSNKPFCDGTHAEIKFRDGLPLAEKGKEW